jgi:hypothetical protein
MPFKKDDLVLESAITLVPDHMMKNSSDNLRNALGTVVSLVDYTPEKGFGTYKTYERTALEVDPTDPHTDLRDIDVLRAECLSDKISYIETNVYNTSIIDSSVATPNLKIPFRLYADEDTVYGDVHWREIFTGGTWADENYKNLINTNNVYYDTCTSINTPINYKELRKLEFNTTTDFSGIQQCALKANYLDYNHLVHKYQEWATAVSDELLIPNYDIVSSYYYRSETGILDDITVDTIKEKQIGYSKEKSDVYKYHFPYCRETEGGTEYYNLLKKDEYFGTYFVNTGDNSAYREAAMTHQKNILYDQHYYDFLNENSIDDYEGLLSGESLDIDNKLSTFYNIHIEFDRHMEATSTEIADPTTLPPYETKDFVFNSLNHEAPGREEHAKDYQVTKLIDQYNFSSKFLELLKDVDEGTITDVTRRKMNFHYSNAQHISYENSDGTRVKGEKFSTLNEGERIQLNSMNFLHFLLYAYNNYDVAFNDNYIFVGPDRPEHVATSATDSLYRNMNSQNIIGVIDSVYDLQNSYFRQFFDAATTEPLSKTEDIIEKILSPQQKFKEVLAYKIEKFVSTAIGDYSTQTPIQKFWLFNSQNAPEKLKITDSQVKYGKNYTYKITAYTLIVSHKYRYQDFRLTKQIGTGKLLPDHDSTIQYCLQFYNPENNEISPQLLTPKIDPTLLEEASSALAGLNEYATNEVEVTEYPQVADFHLYLEPCLELVEIPFYQKTIKVLENPPNAINVVPFHFIDDSNRVGFKIGQDSFIQRTYPEIITDEDVTLRDDFLNSREYIIDNKITDPSESPARYIEMYRITQKPNALSDFKDGLVATMDLRIPNDVYNYADHIAADKIFPNKKYYYLFRLLNENRNPGPISQIIECELVNDGGYVYSLFDTVDTSEFNSNKITTNSISFKKIMQIEPHLDQMYFDTSEIDYGDYAVNQIDNLIVGTADELIWDKKFKIRLTSKKTGKKLDLNISFNKREQNLSKLREMEAPPDEFCDPGPPTDTTLDVAPEETETTEAETFSPAEADCEGCRDEIPDTPPTTGEGPPTSEEEETEEQDTFEEEDEEGGENPDDPTNNENPTENDDTDDTDENNNNTGANTEQPPENQLASDPPDLTVTTPIEGNYVLNSGDQLSVGKGMPVSTFKMLTTSIGPQFTNFLNKFSADLFDSSTGQFATTEARNATLRYLYLLVWSSRTEWNKESYKITLDGEVVSGATMLYAELSHAVMLLVFAQIANLGTEPNNRTYTPDGVEYDPGMLFGKAYQALRNWITATELWWTDEYMQGPGLSAPEDHDLDAIYMNMNNLDVPNFAGGYDATLAADLEVAPPNLAMADVIIADIKAYSAYGSTATYSDVLFYLGDGSEDLSVMDLLG